MRSRAPRGTLAFSSLCSKKSNEFTIEVTHDNYLILFFNHPSLAGSSYYGWRSAKSAKNRQETQEQKRLRSILLFVNVLLFAGFLSLVITILNDAFILTGHEGLLHQGLRMLLGSGVTVKSTSTSLTLFTATIDFLRMSVNIGFLLCLRAFLINLYRSDILSLKMLSWFVGQHIC